MDASLKPGDICPEHVFKHMPRAGGAPEDVAGNEVLAGKKVLVVGVVSPFSPVCNKRHLPEYIPLIDIFKENGGIDDVVCISVADPFSLNHWASQVDPEEKMKFLSDADGSFAEKLGLLVDLSDSGLGHRSTRYSMVVDDGTISSIKVEERPSVMEVTSAEAMMRELGIDT